MPDGRMRDPSCGHLLCNLVGGSCSLVSGVSRGCRTGFHPAKTIEPAVYDEIRTLLTALAPERIDADVSPQTREAAARLAAIIRREARDERNVLVLARDDEPELVPRLEQLCRRRKP